MPRRRHAALRRRRTGKSTCRRRVVANCLPHSNLRPQSWTAIILLGRAGCLPAVWGVPFRWIDSKSCFAVVDERYSRVTVPGRSKISDDSMMTRKSLPKQGLFGKRTAVGHSLAPRVLPPENRSSRRAWYRLYAQRTTLIVKRWRDPVDDRPKDRAPKPYNVRMAHIQRHGP